MVTCMYTSLFASKSICFGLCSWLSTWLSEGFASAEHSTRLPIYIYTNPCAWAGYDTKLIYIYIYIYIYISHKTNLSTER